MRKAEENDTGKLLDIYGMGQVYPTRERAIVACGINNDFRIKYFWDKEFLTEMLGFRNYTLELEE
jgi:hypothetical protein